jgi:hypothetical protein
MSPVGASPQQIRQRDVHCVVLALSYFPYRASNTGNTRLQEADTGSYGCDSDWDSGKKECKNCIVRDIVSDMVLAYLRPRRCAILLRRYIDTFLDHARPGPGSK